MNQRRGELEKLVSDTEISEREQQQQFFAIQEEILQRSRSLDAANFSRFHPDDLQLLFEAYDERYFDGLLHSALGDVPLEFRISSRMSKAGGKTGRYSTRSNPKPLKYEIVLSSTLLFLSFQNESDTAIVTGLKCHNRLEAVQRVFEHELTHLIEFLIWDRSRCSQKRFQSIANRFFGHTDYHHQLVTMRELASKEHGVRVGSYVRFEFEGQQLTGLVNRITKRATVLVEDRQGPRYSNGKRYMKYYVPVHILTAIER